jgi:MFS family permease
MLGMANRDLKLLVVAQALGMSIAPFLTFLSGIIAARIAPDPRLATLPAALSIGGAAVCSVPAAILMRRFGRRQGFMFAAATAAAAALIAAFAVQREWFWLFCGATLALGLNRAFVQQYRFAAAETVPIEDSGRAISTVMLGALGAAIIGPELASFGRPVAGLSAESVAFVMLAGVMMMSFAVLSRLGDIRPPREVHRERVPLRRLLMRVEFVVAVLAATVAYGVMSFIMTATPISMNVIDGHSMPHTARVVQSHVFFMYLPSLVSGHFIRRFSCRAAMALGAGAMILAIAVAASGRGLAIYWLALVLVGVGWNFLFVGGTTLVAETFRGADRFTAQATNDLLVFSLNGVAVIGSGAVIFSLGWSGVLGIALAPVVPFVAVLGSWALADHRRRVRAW